jgi:hypothetical protein
MTSAAGGAGTDAVLGADGDASVAAAPFVTAVRISFLGEILASITA